MNSKNRWLPVVILLVGSFIGLIKGAEARQRWVFKMKNRSEEKRQQAEQKRLLRSGGVALDDIELAAFHK